MPKCKNIRKFNVISVFPVTENTQKETDLIEDVRKIMTSESINQIKKREDLGTEKTLAIRGIKHSDRKKKMNQFKKYIVYKQFEGIV